MKIYEIPESDARVLLREEGVLEHLFEGNEVEIDPKWDDLARLYVLVRQRKPFQILEFGSGFSTIVMAIALKKNWEDYLKISREQNIDEPAFQKPSLCALESSEIWMENTCNKLHKAKLDHLSEVLFSEVSIAEYDSQICHFYKHLPDIVPDFIYLDGPDPVTVSGTVNGLSFKNPKRTVMSGDLLKYESTLLPGFFLIIDGRTNNARFLERNVKRNYEIQYHPTADVTTFELSESKLGRKNIFGSEAYMGESENR